MKKLAILLSILWVIFISFTKIAISGVNIEIKRYNICYTRDNSTLLDEDEIKNTVYKERMRFKDGQGVICETDSKVCYIISSYDGSSMTLLYCENK